MTAALSEPSLRAMSLRLARDPETALELEAYMRDLSEENYCASWLIGLEHALWSFVVNGPGRWGQDDVTAENIAELKRLSSEAGGWWKWDDEGDGPVFVPTWVWELETMGRP